MVLLVIVGALAFTGISTIVGHAQEVITGNKLDGGMAQNEVDHLNWANQVNALLTDDHVTELTAQTDPTQCRFGKWLHSDARRAAEQTVPSITPLLAEIERYHADLHTSAVEIKNVFQQADVLLPGKLCARQVDHLEWASKVEDLFLHNRPQLDVQTDPTKCALGQWLASDECRSYIAADPTFGRLIEALKEPHRKLHESATAIQGVWQQRHTGLRQLLTARLDDHRQWAAQVCRAAALEDPNFDVQMDPSLCAFGQFLGSEQCQQWRADFPALDAALSACEEPHRRLHASAQKLKDAFNAGDTAAGKRVYTEETVPALDAVAEHFYEAIAAETAFVDAQEQARKIFDEQTTPALAGTRQALHTCQEHATAAVDGMRAANQIFATKTQPNLVKVQELLAKVRDEVKKNVMTDEAMLAAAQGTKRNVSLVSLAAVIIGIVLAIFITRAISRPIIRVVHELSQGSALVAEASGQVNASALSLAEGSSEQASSLEETSAALEEMSAMTQTNASNAREADDLSVQARDAAHQSDREMSRLNGAMADINESSGQISKIIKVIEEIAFQTNLLALNAAVEAARAGEHGKGFAVVAEEVRNLAQRAAQAARETTSLIEESVTRAKEGGEVSNGFGQTLSRIVNNVSRVSELVSSINKASSEQAQGVEQINLAVSQMDKVTQSIAASAEESASAVEELSAQADAVARTAGELASFVGANVNNIDSQEVARTIRSNIQRRQDNLHTRSTGSVQSSAPAGGRSASKSAASAAFADEETLDAF
jgi:methyl-accepting chemotaxis protein